MGAIVYIFVVIGIGCGICLTIGIVLNALVKSNNIGQREDYNNCDYIDYSSLTYHAIYDDKDGIIHFDGYYK